MKHPFLTTIALLLFSSALLAQNTLPSTTTGYINFNVGSSEIQPQKEYSSQGVTLFGCNTIISNNSTENWSEAPNGLQWNTKNQVFANLPYGYQIDKKTNAPYYVSKYYIASPPVFLRNKEGKPTPNTQYDIGIVTPDEFVFKGDKPVQSVYLDYDILKLVKIKYIPVVFDASFDLWKVDVVPFKVECKDFPWLDKEVYNDAQGASGIGSLNRKIPPLTRLFLPYYEDEVTPNQSKQFLDCEVTILNDILFHHEIYFKVNGEKRYSINLKDFYNKHKNDKKMEITLYCDYRNELPCGCKEPTSEKPYNKDKG
ncbi:hypothetical protein [Aquimarina sp. 2201CG5-10]|uniref:hypothetical protein n=1 Tax=Aquimarina callyspongiae TaxID=3098150 RepID=UPI002AB3567A|nr:hypothetical protein [Aquimarina sp. 2201CG5-10]MDY8135008.1 hypothetical protein [Aquimarina sp. 2201CG5-10]